MGNILKDNIVLLLDNYGEDSQKLHNSFKLAGKNYPVFVIEEDGFLHKFKGFHGFTKSHRSSFSYWFSHWCAFQMLALVLGRWKVRYLFHDLEKPWLKLIFPYKKIQSWHRRYNRHHLEYGLRNGWDKVDWEALIIDWECSHYTKKEAQLDAYETMERELRGKWKEYKEEIAPRFYNKLKELGL